MATRKIETTRSKEVIYREEWPRIRTVSVRGVEFFQCDGRPHYQRKIFSSLIGARKQAETWENTRTKYGTAGRNISEKDASRFAEALDILRPHGAGIIDAARHYAQYLAKEKHLAENARAGTTSSTSSTSRHGHECHICNVVFRSPE